MLRTEELPVGPTATTRIDLGGSVWLQFSKSGLSTNEVLAIANAGGAKFALLGKITEEHYDALFNSNVKGLLFTVQKALPLLPDGASIILNASIGGSTAPLPESSVYNVNAVSPGYTDTPPWHSTEASEKSMKMISNSIPLGRFGSSDEIARAVMFLASDDASYITGTELFVDGGFAQV